jgi:hypothetical protein
VADPHQIGAGIFAGPHQIAYRLNLPIGHRHRRDLTQAQQLGQMRGIAGIFSPDRLPGAMVMKRTRFARLLRRPRKADGVVLRTSKAWLLLSAAELDRLIGFVRNEPHIQRYPMPP